MKGIYIDRLLRFLFKVVPSAMIMGMVLFITNACFVPDTSAKVVQLLNLIFQIALGVLVYFAAVLVLKVEEALYFKIWLYQGLKNSKKMKFFMCKIIQKLLTT